MPISATTNPYKLQRPLSSFTNASALVNATLKTKKFLVRPFIEENEEEGVQMIGESANVSVIPTIKEIEATPEIENFVDEYMNYQSVPLNNISIGAGK